jgi:hypothetical protein
MPGIENFSYFASGIVWTGKRFNRRPTTHPQPLGKMATIFGGNDWKAKV